MSLSTLLNLPCTIERRTAATEDAYGNDVATVVEVDTVCELQPVSRAESQVEPAGQGELSVTVWKAWFLPGTVIDTSDAVTVEGYGTFEVLGDAPKRRNPRTQLQHHVHATLKRTGPE